MAHALTRVFDGIVDSITTNVTVKNAFTDSKISTIGIWDTGATGSVITKSTAQKLGLKPVSAAKVRGVHGERIVNVYAVEITLHNDQITLTTSVTECDELSGDKSIGVLIGMDIIQMGDFCITHENGKTIMSFIKPSQKAINFVEDIREYNRMLTIHNAWKKQGNERCPCGSGKLYKNFHGKITYK